MFCLAIVSMLIFDFQVGLVLKVDAGETRGLSLPQLRIHVYCIIVSSGRMYLFIRQSIIE